MREELGTTLKHARSRRGLSLESVSGAAKISQGYLHKLEAGRVNNPSPHVLQRLAHALDLPYRRLMELSEYLMPRDSADTAPPVKTNPAVPETETRTGAPTFTELALQLAAIRTELAELAAGQQRLVQAIERLAPASATTTAPRGAPDRHAR